MSMFINGKKFKAVYLNSKSWYKAYLGGDLIFSKEKPLNFVAKVWWNNNGTIVEETIDTAADLSALCGTSPSYNITVNGHTFRNTKVKDIQFGNSNNFPSTIPTNFGYHFTNLNVGSQSGVTSLTLPQQVTTIDDGFFESSSFNATDFTASGVTSIGDNFLYSTPANCTLSLPAISTIGNNFLAECFSYNKSISINPSSIGDSFLAIKTVDTNSMNSNVNLGTRCTSIGDEFMSSQTGMARHVFDATLTLPSTLQTIGSGFLSFSDYSGTLDLSNYDISSIGDQAFYNSKVGHVILPTTNPLSIGDEFMYAHEGAIGNTFIIPSNVIYMGESFLYNNNNYYTYSNIQCNANPSSWGVSSSLLEMSYQKYDTSDMEYITVTGTYASALKSKYRASSRGAEYEVSRYYTP